MFKEMRKQAKKITEAEAIGILEKGEYGVLSTICANGYAYGIPLSYVYKDHCIYLHCAVEGQKLTNIRSNNKVSFCVIGETELLPEQFSTKFESVVVFGQAIEVEDQEKQAALLAIIEKYANQFMEQGKEYIKKAESQTKVIKIVIEHITGKARRWN